MSKLTFFILLIALVLVGCNNNEILIPEDQPVEFRNGNGPLVERPFKGRVSGAAPTPAEPCNLGMILSGELAGNLTHLGLTTAQYTYCGQSFVGDDPASVSDHFIIEGEYAAPPLDTIIIITDFFTFDDGTNQGSRTLEGSYFVMGGTGRFENADGAGEIRGTTTANPTDPDGTGVTIEFEGKILY